MTAKPPPPDDAPEPADTPLDAPVTEETIVAYAPLLATVLQAAGRAAEAAGDPTGRAYVNPRQVIWAVRAYRLRDAAARRRP